MSTRLLGCTALLLLFLVTGLALAMFLFGEHNALVEEDEAVAAQWAQVETVYQRRADLVPNLVATVRGAAEFEQETLQEVVAARARVGQLEPDTERIVEDPAAFERFDQAQSALSSALGRLLVVVERYPELRSVAAFQDLMVQLEGTENRIAVERRRYNETARDFNVRLKRIPTRWFVRLLGWPFEEKTYFEAAAGAEITPTVDL